MVDAAPGKGLMLGAGKTYGIGASGLTLPANTTLVVNGSKFRKLVASSTYGITVGDGANIDRLELDIAVGNVVQDASVRVAGSGVRIGFINVAVLTSGATPNAPLAAVYVGMGTGVAISNLDIGRIQVSGVQLPVILDTLRSVTLGWVEFSNYKCGLHIKDCQRLLVAGGCVTSPGCGGYRQCRAERHPH